MGYWLPVMEELRTQTTATTESYSHPRPETQVEVVHGWPPGMENWKHQRSLWWRWETQRGEPLLETLPEQRQGVDSQASSSSLSPVGPWSNQTRNPLTRSLPPGHRGRGRAGLERSCHLQGRHSRAPKSRLLDTILHQGPMDFEKSCRDPDRFGLIGFPREDSPGFMPVWGVRAGQRKKLMYSCIFGGDRKSRERARVCRDAGNDPRRNEATSTQNPKDSDAPRQGRLCYISEPPNRGLKWSLQKLGVRLSLGNYKWKRGWIS